MFQMAIGTCEFAKSLSVFSHFKCYHLPSPCPKKLIGSGRFPQVALVGAGGGSGPLALPRPAPPMCSRVSDKSTKRTAWNLVSPPGINKKPTMMGLPGRGRSLTISSAVWIQCTNVRDGRAGGRTDGHHGATAKTALTHSVEQ